jgi:putative flippase GtrA
MRRMTTFIAVGAIGFVVQLGVLFCVSSLWHWPYLVATLVAVECAVLHNFLWHEHWTWRDRHEGAGRTGEGTACRLARFQVGTGLSSLTGNVIITAAGVQLFRMSPITANVCAVVVSSLANFLIADRWAFRAAAIGAVVGPFLLTSTSVAAADLRPDTLAAWARHVAAVERTAWDCGSELPPAEPQGKTIGVPGGIIHEWRGSVLIHDIAVDRLVDALENPGVPPPADDILESRVLGRAGNTLHVYLKLARSAVITVTYDTEHDVTFMRRLPLFAASRSVSTSIREEGGSDRGFLWRLNSYWRYRQQGDDVLVDVLSVSLSRDVPMLARPIASPVINRIARESMRRTLDALDRFAGRLRPTTSQDRGARTSTPADVSPARIHAAREGAPAVSPWMQMESTSTCRQVPSMAATVRSSASCVARVTTSSMLEMTAPG